MSTTIYAASDENIARAKALLCGGELIGLPTETVYGLAADASNADAVASIFIAKGRPANHPLIVHLANAAEAKRWAGRWPEAAEKLALAFWPGPMTLIVDRAAHVLDDVTGGQQTVGLRVPSHPVAQRLLAAFGGGLAAPSANKFGRVSPTLPEHVAQEFLDDDVFVLDGGACEIGVESTIIDVSGKAPRILRPGRIRAYEVERVLAMPLETSGKNAPRVSGSLESHYAPRKKTLMLDGDALELFLHAARDSGKRVGLIFYDVRFRKAKARERIELSHLAADQFEHDLYASLRKLDESSVDLLVIETPPTGADWEAIHDRLQRATHQSFS